MGLYQMVFPLYTLLLTLSSGGFPVAISRVVALCLARGDERGAKKTFRVCLVTLIALGIIGSLILIIFAPRLASFQGNRSASLAYIGIAPAVTFVAVLSCYRGYYQGRENMFPSALSQLIEQVGKLLIGLTLAGVMLSRGAKYGVFGALLGVSLSEAISVIFVLCYHAVGKTRVRGRLLEGEIASDITVALPKKKVKSDTANILKSVFSLAIPVTFGALVIPLTQVVDSVLIINILSRLGHEVSQATMAYGLVSGTVTTLVNVPVVVISAVSMTLLPKIARVSLEPSKVIKEGTTGLKICLALGLMAFLITFTYSDKAIELLYSSGLNSYQKRLASRLLRINSLTVFYVSLVQVSTAVLQGVGKAKRPAVNLAIGGGVKILVTALTLPLFGIYGAVIGSVACYGLTAILDVRAVRKEVGLPALTVRWQALPISGGAFLLSGFLLMRFLPGIVGIFLSVVVGSLLYITGLFAFKWFSFAEVRRLLPFFRRKDRQTRKNC